MLLLQLPLRNFYGYPTQSGGGVELHESGGEKGFSPKNLKELIKREPGRSLVKDDGGEDPPPAGTS